jgi:hypothetical protein
MTRDQALAKIKKCLALGRSSNPHEGAAAMRQAQKLMAEHLITSDDVALADVKTKQCSTPTNSGPVWEVALAKNIAEAFGCAVIWTRDAGRFIGYRHVRKSVVIFYGLENAPEIAGYAWDVLSRQCAKGRLAHIRLQSKQCKPITRTARGDEYAMGWVIGVIEKLERFAAPEKNTLLIEQFKDATWPSSTTGKAPDRTKGRNVTTNDFHTGLQHGKLANLNHGLDGQEPQALLS